MRHFTSTVLLAGLLLTGTVRAQTSRDEATYKAATLFDQGVREFSQGNYAQAARSFLAADDAAPSQEAITNAMSAALKADQYVVAARAAERALSRASSDESTRKVARSTLAKVTPKLARLEVACGPAPCTVELDGEPVPLGVSYVAPGNHQVVGRTTEGREVTAQVGCTAAAPCRVALETPPPPAPPAPGPVEEPAPRSEAVATKQPPPPADTPPLPVADRPSRQERLALGLFAGLGAATLALTAVTTWSGVDAVNEHEQAEKPPLDDNPNDAWKPQAQRTDRLLGATLACAAATLGAGLWWGKLRARRRATLSLVPARGLTLSVQARF